jgi:hypothetical protein
MELKDLTYRDGKKHVSKACFGMQLSSGMEQQRNSSNFTLGVSVTLILRGSFSLHKR